MIWGSILYGCACGSKKDEPESTYRCIQYANEVFGQCLDAVHHASEPSHLQCDPSLIEIAYNACNVVLESGQDVCVPLDASMRYGCQGYVHPPAPPNWRGVGAAAPMEHAP